MSDLVVSPATAPEPPAGDVASRLYGSPSAPEQGAPAPSGSVAERLYGNLPDPTRSEAPRAQEQPAPSLRIEVPEHIRAERSADAERMLYDTQQTYKSALSNMIDLPEGIDPDMASAIRAEAGELMADMALSPVEAADLVGMARRLASEPPSDETRQAWRNQAAQQLQEIYGNDAGHELSYALEWVKQDPRRMQLMERNGLGDHPQVITLAVELARRQRLRGKRGNKTEGSKT